MSGFRAFTRNVQNESSKNLYRCSCVTENFSAKYSGFFFSNSYHRWYFFDQNSFDILVAHANSGRLFVSVPNPTHYSNETVRISLILAETNEHQYNYGSYTVHNSAWRFRRKDAHTARMNASTHINPKRTNPWHYRASLFRTTYCTIVRT